MTSTLPSLTQQPKTAPPAIAHPQTDFERAAQPVLKQLARSARRHDGIALWLDTEGKETASHLYSGSVGIALTLALWGKNTRNQVALKLAREALDMPRRRSKRLLEKIAEEEGLAKPRLGGGFFSLGSIIYGLARSALILDSREIAAEARDLATLVTPELVANQKDCGLSSGVAGLTIALLVAGRAADQFKLEHELSSSVQACGTKLREFLDQRDRCCPPGLAHGLSGIAYALTRLHEVDPDGYWQWDAHSALAQERRLFDGVKRTWRIPNSDQIVIENSWDQGPAGMLLARAAMVARGVYPMDPVSEADLEIVLRLTRKQAARRKDTLDGGNLGHALILQQSGIWLGIPELVDDAKQIGRTVAARCPDSLFVTSRQLDYGAVIKDAGLMTGLAGVAYALLRLSRRRLPCLMLME